MKSSIPKTPKHLSREAAVWWRKILADYELPDDALLVLTVALESFDRMREAQAQIGKHGVCVVDAKGQLKPNPAAAIERDSRAAMLASIKVLGLNLEPIASPGRPPQGGI